MAEKKKRSLVASLLVCYNILLLLFAIIFIAASSFVSSQFKDDSWADILFHQVSNGGVVAGVLTGLVALVGLYAASLKKRKLLACYLIFLFIIIIIQMSAAAGMTVYSNQFQIRKATQPSGSLTSTIEIYANNAVFSMYTVCCSGCLPNQCNNPEWPVAQVNLTHLNCLNSNCTYIPGCTSKTQDRCFILGENRTVPTSVFTPSICTALSNIKLGRGPYLVGPASKGSCGRGDPKIFLADLDAWFSGIAFNAAVVFYVISFIEVIVLAGAIYLICCASKETVQVLTGFNVDEVDDDWKA